ncbi:MAG: cell division protein CrgA, partial [Acidimicrobiales bacterium]
LYEEEAQDDDSPAETTSSAPKRRETIRETAAAKASSTAPRAQKPGRATPKGGPSQPPPRSGRYTPPIPKEKRQSPRWFAPMLLGFLVLGLATIVLNYVNVLPGGTSNWYLITGIVFIVVGLFMATFYH